MAELVRSFADLGLPPALLAALSSVGYETPTPIQARTLPPLLAGRDVLGHAPTGTGKTAAFALPILARLDVGKREVQAIVLTPTRELAIQVAEAFTRYASSLPRVGVLPVYGGQDYAVQLKALSRGVQIVVGTPGRVTDHLRRGTLKLDRVSTLVLDEADEMLRMGFVDDVEWILDKTPESRQTALFSATMPPQIKRIAKRHLKNPEEIGIEGRRSAASTIRQRVWIVGGMNKLEALTRLLEVERFDAMLVFVRTKSSTVELAEKLEARGFAAQAMNGDMPQKERERQVDKLKSGALDILVATDVVARGLDVERISHVVNFDIPYDTEAYVHRIGRTGRAGRVGDAILFAAPRERRLLGAIEKATGQKIENLQLPTVDMVNERRVEAFESRITDTLSSGNLDFLENLVNQYAAESNQPMSRVAAALASLAIGERPLLLDDGRSRKRRTRDDNAARSPKENVRQNARMAPREATEEAHRSTRKDVSPKAVSAAGRESTREGARGAFRKTSGNMTVKESGATTRGTHGETAKEVAGETTVVAARDTADVTAPKSAGRTATETAGKTPEPSAGSAEGENHQNTLGSNTNAAPTENFGADVEGGAGGYATESSRTQPSPNDNTRSTDSRNATNSTDGANAANLTHSADSSNPPDSTDSTDSTRSSRPDVSDLVSRASVNDIVMERFRVEVGTDHGAEVANIVGAIANEADIRAEYIGRVDMQADHSFIELPEGMPKFMLKELRRVWVAGRQLGLSRLSGDRSSHSPSGKSREKSSSVRTLSGSEKKPTRKFSSGTGKKRREENKNRPGKPRNAAKGKGKPDAHRKGTARSES